MEQGGNTIKHVVTISRCSRLMLHLKFAHKAAFWTTSYDSKFEADASHVLFKCINI